jgi:hydroxymethylpyrimidine pyrophosphatase-like HAD family hydrolase
MSTDGLVITIKDPCVKSFTKENFGESLANNLDHCAFVGDSPNDEPLFAFFKNSMAVANIKSFEDQLTHHPQYVADKEGGEGFVEIGQKILEALK